MGTALRTDHYELTMVAAALRSGTAEIPCIFEVFARSLPLERRYGVVAGTGRLREAIEDFCFTPEDLAYLQQLGFDAALIDWCRRYFFDGEIHGYREGELWFPNSPILTVIAPFATAVVLETLVLSTFNFDSAIAGAAARMATAARGIPLLEMGGRHIHSAAAVDAARAAYIGGSAGTSNLEAGRRYGIPTIGTSAHAFVLLHANERDAFASQIATHGTDTTLLVDTHNVEAGIDNAVSVAGTKLKAIRIDSGDLAAEATRARTQLDRLGARETQIVLSGDLGELEIEALRDTPVDSFGVGTNLVTGSKAPTCGFVYKMVAVAESSGQDFRPVSKSSKGKETIGGRKYAFRYLDDQNRAKREVLAMRYDGSKGRPLQQQLFDGKQWAPPESLTVARARVLAGLAELDEQGLILTPGPPAINTEVVE